MASCFVAHRSYSGVLFQANATAVFFRYKRTWILANDQTYRLWAQTPEGLQGCMSFVPNAQGSVSLQVPSEPSGSATQVKISVDPITAGSGPEQPGRTVLVSA